MSLKDEGQLYPVIVNKDGTILDGMHRFEILGRLGKEVKYEVRDFPDKRSEKIFALEVNLKRRHLNKFQKAEMGNTLLKIETLSAKERMGQKGVKEGEVASFEASSGKATKIVSEKIGLARSTFERAKKVLDDGPEEIKELCRKEALHIAPAFGLTKALEDVPETPKKTLVDKLVGGQMEPKEIFRAVASTKAVKAQLEGEEEDVKEKAEALFKDKYYTPELDSKEAIWQIEEIAGDPHHLITREFPLEDFASFEDAQAWAVKRDGVCLGKLEKWHIKFDPVKAKKLE